MSKADETAKKPLDPSSLFCMVDGVRVPTFFEKTCKRPAAEHVQRLRAMELNPNDVMLLAFAKSGTHWIWEVISMLLSGKAEYEKRTKEFVMMEATEIEKMESEPSPRVLNSHFPLKLLPRQILEKKVKIIHVYRNVKDILVSAYFHFRQASDMKDLTMDDLERMMISPNAPGGNYFTFLQDMDEFQKNNPDFPFFTMSFEDTKEDPRKAIQKLADFLGVEASAQLCQDIAEATSFTKMKQADKTKQQMELPGEQEVQMYRKGEVGDWKNHMTVAQSERLDAAMTLLKSCDYRFRFTL